MPRAFLLLHGLTASPKQFETFGRALFERGANVYIPRLPHHGYTDRLTNALAELTAEQLIAFAHQAYRETEPLGRRIGVVGFSMGGLLAAWIAQHHAAEQVIAVAPFLGFAWLPNRLTTRIGRMVLALPNRFLWWHPLKRERLMPAHGYPRYPTHAIGQTLRMARALFAEAEREPPRAKAILLVVNSGETTVSNRTIGKLGSLWQRGGNRTAIVTHVLRGMPPSHDVIDPERSPQAAARVHRELLRLVDA
jgi:pimeloyl-ACP methyl ester carboxylesterase